MPPDPRNISVSTGSASSDSRVSQSSSSSPSSTEESSSEEEARSARRLTHSFFGWRHSHRHASVAVPISVDNPFESQSTWTAYEVFKLVFVGLTLFWLRLLLLLVLTFCMLLIIVCATLGLSVKEEDGCFVHNEPLAQWRLNLLRPCAAMSRGMLWCMGFWCIHCMDHRRGSDEMPNIIVVAPHMTFVDMLVVCWIFPPFVSFVADAKILQAPLAYRVAVATQSIFVRMRDPASRRRTGQLLEVRAQPIWQGLPTAIFPEGRITNGAKLIQFKPGAFRACQPVLPVLLRYPYRFLDPSATGSNWGPLWFLRMMTQFTNHCTVEVLRPREPTEAEMGQPDLFAADVRNLMARELGVETTEHTVEDALLYRAAQPFHVDSDFQVEAMRRVCKVDLPELMTWLEAFHQVDRDNSGIIDRKEFRAVLSSMSRQDADRLFDFFDTDESGTLEYREFVQGLALLSGHCSAEGSAQLAFLMYDKDGSGTIPRARLGSALDRAFPSCINMPGIPPPSTSADSLRFQVAQACSLSAQQAGGEPPRTSLAATLLARDGALADSDEIGYDSFCRLVEQNPQLLERALSPLKQHFRDLLDEE